MLTHSGARLLDLEFANPISALFFNHDPSKLIVACIDGIFFVAVCTHSIQPFSNTPLNSWYCPHAIALTDDDTVMVVGINTFLVCGFDTMSLERLWIYKAASSVGAVCMIGTRVLVTVKCNSTLIMDQKTGAHVALLPKAEGHIFGMGVIEGLCFILSYLSPFSDLHTSVYLALLQHLLHKQAKPLHLPLEMWDWIARYRV